MGSLTGTTACPDSRTWNPQWLHHEQISPGVASGADPKAAPHFAPSGSCLLHGFRSQAARWLPNASFTLARESGEGSSTQKLVVDTSEFCPWAVLQKVLSSSAGSIAPDRYACTHHLRHETDADGQICRVTETSGYYPSYMLDEEYIPRFHSPRRH